VTGKNDLPIMRILCKERVKSIAIQPFVKVGNTCDNISRPFPTRLLSFDYSIVKSTIKKKSFHCKIVREFNF
jgi:hypothetical protein